MSVTLRAAVPRSVWLELQHHWPIVSDEDDLVHRAPVAHPGVHEIDAVPHVQDIPRGQRARSDAAAVVHGRNVAVVVRGKPERPQRVPTRYRRVPPAGDRFAQTFEVIGGVIQGSGAQRIGQNGSHGVRDEQEQNDLAWARQLARPSGSVGSVVHGASQDAVPTGLLETCSPENRPVPLRRERGGRSATHGGRGVCAVSRTVDSRGHRSADPDRRPVTHHARPIAVENSRPRSTSPSRSHPYWWGPAP